MTRVEAARNAFDCKNNNVSWKEIIQPAFDDVRSVLYRRCNLHMGHLPKRVNAGVRASRALHLDIAAEHLSRSSTQFAHDRAGILLLLPAAVPRTVVFD